MARKRSALSQLAERVAKNVRTIPDSEIDFSDIPETTEEEFKRARRVGRPVTGTAKMLIALRISPSVLARLRSQAAKHKKPYQTYIHEILERAVRKFAA